MTPEQWEKIEKLYHAALELASAERATFLDKACASDDDLRREIESLLASHDEAASFIESPPDDVVAGMVAEDQTRSMIGLTLGHYKIQSLLGAGGMGEVYRARDLRLDRDVAVKILPEHLSTNSEALRRFEREAKAVAALSHPNILAIHDFGAEGGLSYAVMELLEGETLRDTLNRSALNWRKAVEIGAAIAEGLAAAHAKGIIHRDLKPENIFLTADGRVKILDFGIARVKHRVLPDSETLTSTVDTTKPGLVMGTIGYMSPEQVRGETAEAPSDIFSFGCVLYEMVGGRRPFERKTGAEMIAAILNEEPPPLTNLEKTASARLERIVRHCLEKSPGQRYQSARDLASDLGTLLSGGGQAISAPAFTRRRRRAVMWAGAALMVLLLAVSMWLSLAGGRGGAIDSLAILPLVNTSGEANVEYLSDGIAEGLINNLSQLPGLRVMARATAFSYKGKQVDPRQIGRELNVRAVLTGKLIQSGDTLSIQVDLVNAADGSQLWGERYNRKLTDLSAVEEEIARRISEKLRLRLTGEEQSRLGKRRTESEEAHQLYLKGRHYWNNWTGGEIRKGLEYFEQALQIDPNYAPAWVGLAEAYYGLSGVYLPSKEMMPKVRAAAQKALEIDETLGEAHASLALAKMVYEWDWQGAEKEFKRTIELAPGYGTAHFGYGLYLVVTGCPDEALRELRLAQELDPLSPSIAVTAAWPYYYAPPPLRRYDQAAAQLQKVIETYPDFAPAYGLLSFVYMQTAMFEEAIRSASKAKEKYDAPDNLAGIGIAYAAARREAEARKVVAELQELSKQKHLSSVHLARIYAALGEKDQALAMLQKARDEREEEVALIKVDPRFDSLHSDPQFVDLLRSLNLAP